MEKSYQLCDAGNKVVLRRLTEPDYEMRTVLVADSLVRLKNESEHELSCIDGLPFFILKQENAYFICWERAKCIQVVPDCEAYLLFDNNVLLKKAGCWYWWSKEAFASGLYPLGKQISALGRLFIFKLDKGYQLNYFEGKELKTCSCDSYEILNVNFQEHLEKSKELFPDVLSISDGKGVHFISVERTTTVTSLRSGRCYEYSYAFQFKDEPSEELIEFATYVQNFCDKMSKEDICITDAKKICDYAYIREYTSEHREFKISLNIDLRGSHITCVSVIANISKLYHGEDEAYQINCSELDYYKSADDVWLESTEREKALLMTCDGKTDKISCIVSGAPKERYLSLLKDV